MKIRLKHWKSTNAFRKSPVWCGFMSLWYKDVAIRNFKWWALRRDDIQPFFVQNALVWLAWHIMVPTRPCCIPHIARSNRLTEWRVQGKLYLTCGTGHSCGLTVLDYFFWGYVKAHAEISPLLALIEAFEYYILAEILAKIMKKIFQKLD